jgi:phage terminase small subunit
MSRRDLSKKQISFCEQYVIDGNGTRAAKAAGYSERSAHAVACKMLKNANVKDFLDILIAQRAERTKVDADFVINGLLEVVQRSLTRVPVTEWDYMEKRLKQKTQPVMDKEGEIVEATVWTFDSAGANSALKTLAQINGMLVDTGKRNDDEEAMKKLKSGMTLLREPNKNPDAL